MLTVVKWVNFSLVFFPFSSDFGWVLIAVTSLSFFLSGAFFDPSLSLIALFAGLFSLLVFWLPQSTPWGDLPLFFLFFFVKIVFDDALQVNLESPLRGWPSASFSGRCCH